MASVGPSFPAPYRAALALSIDCDGCTIGRLHEVLRYWATDEATPLGKGLSLPVAASMFACSRNPAAPPQASYLDGDREGLIVSSVTQSRSLPRAVPEPPFPGSERWLPHRAPRTGPGDRMPHNGPGPCSSAG